MELFGILFIAITPIYLLNKTVVILTMQDYPAKYSEGLRLPCQPTGRAKNALVAEPLLRKVYRRELTLVSVDVC